MPREPAPTTPWTPAVPARGDARIRWLSLRRGAALVACACVVIGSVAVGSDAFVDAAVHACRLCGGFHGSALVSARAPCASVVGVLAGIAFLSIATMRAPAAMGKRAEH